MKRGKRQQKGATCHQDKRPRIDSEPYAAPSPIRRSTRLGAVPAIVKDSSEMSVVSALRATRSSSTDVCNSPTFSSRRRAKAAERSERGQGVVKKTSRSRVCGEPVVVHLYGDSNSVGFKDCRSRLWTELQSVLGRKRAIVTRLARGGATICPTLKAGRVHFLEWLMGPKTGLRQKYHPDFGGSEAVWEDCKDRGQWIAPDIAVLMLGTNDVSSWDLETCGPPEGPRFQALVKKHLHELVLQIQSLGGKSSASSEACTIAFCLPPWAQQRRSEVKLGVHAALAAYARDNNYLCVDAQFRSGTEDYYPDRVHITKVAATRLARLLGSVFEENGLI